MMLRAVSPFDCACKPNRGCCELSGEGTIRFRMWGSCGSASENPKNAFAYFSLDTNADSGLTVGFVGGADWAIPPGARKINKTAVAIDRSMSSVYDKLHRRAP